MVTPLEPEACKPILRNNYIGHLAYIYLNKPYVLPITYFYNGSKIICYSGEGHKIHALRKNNVVAMEVAEIISVNKWQSVLVHGKYQELQGSNAKALLHEFCMGVKAVIMQKETRDLHYISEFSAKIKNNQIPVVFVVNIEGMTGKYRND